jgi:predicted membrane metal-binding protein
MAVAGLIFGLISLILCWAPSLLSWIPVLGQLSGFGILLFGIIGIILSAIARKKSRSGVATAGLIISIIATIINGIVFIVCIAFAGALAACL